MSLETQLRKMRFKGVFMIPYGHQTIEEDDIQAVVEALRSSYITTGPYIERFEREAADYVGAKYAVAVSSGTAALHLACMAAGIQEGDEVITTPITFVASANCVRYCGGWPVFADIDPMTYNIDPAEIEKKITPKTKAIIPVHLAGQPCDMDAMEAIAQKHHLMIIEDAAHAMGAVYKGRKVGSISRLSTFSFHPVKPITTGEGGMVATNDEELYQRLMLLRSHGITRDGNRMTENEGGWYYQQLELGYNYRMTDFQAALGISQLRKLDAFLEKRRDIARRYHEAFAENVKIGIPYVADEMESGWHLYLIRVPEGERRMVYDKLQAAGIGVNVHYIPVYRHPYYRNNGYGQAYCAKAEALYRQIISIPIYPGLTVEEQERVICEVRKVLRF